MSLPRSIDLTDLPPGSTDNEIVPEWRVIIGFAAVAGAKFAKAFSLVSESASNVICKCRKYVKCGRYYMRCRVASHHDPELGPQEPQRSLLELEALLGRDRFRLGKFHEQLLDLALFVRSGECGRRSRSRPDGPARSQYHFLQRFRSDLCFALGVCNRLPLHVVWGIRSTTSGRDPIRNHVS